MILRFVLLNWNHHTWSLVCAEIWVFLRIFLSSASSDIMHYSSLMYNTASSNKYTPWLMKNCKFTPMCPELISTYSSRSAAFTPIKLVLTWLALIYGTRSVSLVIRQLRCHYLNTSCSAHGDLQSSVWHNSCGQNSESRFASLSTQKWIHIPQKHPQRVTPFHCPTSCVPCTEYSLKPHSRFQLLSHHINSNYTGSNHLHSVRSQISFVCDCLHF